MEQSLSMLMTETSPEICRRCSESLEKHGIQVEICARNGAAAYTELVRMRPSAVMLDVFMPAMDAMSLKKRYNENFPEEKTVFYVTGPFQNEDIEREVMENGFSFYFLKPFDPQLMVQRVMEGINGKRGRTALIQPRDEDRVTELLKEIGVPAHIKGYRYVREAIVMVARRPELINSVTKELYPDIAKKYATMATRVERSIRHAIETAWDRGDLEILNYYFGSTINSLRGKPTNSEFIATMSERLSMERERNIRA